MHSGPSSFGNISLTPSGAFVAKYDSLGSIIWAKHINSVIGISIGSSPNGGCYATGWMNYGTASFLPALIRLL